MRSSCCVSRWRYGTARDPILKERLFGLTNSEGNHGEDVKEYYFYLDSTPTHSYMKYLYKYPQAAFPYSDLVATNKRRNRGDLEYELLDTGVFNDDRYFDVFVEYAKQTPEDILIQISVCNRGPEPPRCTCCRPCGFATHGHGGLNTEAILETGRRQEWLRVRSQRHTTELGDRYLVLRGRRPVAVHRERDEQRADFRHAQRRVLTSKMGLTTMW